MWNEAEVGEMAGAATPSEAEAAEMKSEMSRMRTRSTGSWKRRGIAIEREFR